MQTISTLPSPPLLEYCNTYFPHPITVTANLPSMDIHSVRFNKSINYAQSSHLLEYFTRALLDDAPFPDSSARATAAAALTIWPNVQVAAMMNI